MGSLGRRLAFFVLVSSGPAFAQGTVEAPAAPPGGAADAPVPAEPPPEPAFKPALPSVEASTLDAAAPTAVHSPQSTSGHGGGVGRARAETHVLDEGTRPERGGVQPPTSGWRRKDGHVDRVLLLPTAETHPEGATTLSSYDIVLLQVGHALTDSTQLTLTATPPIEGAALFDVSLKQNVVRAPYFRLALIGAISAVSGLDDYALVPVGRAGFAAQACFDAECRSSVNLSASALLAGPATTWVSGGGLVARVSPRVALLAEVVTLAPVSEVIGEYHGALAGAGIRWSGRDFGLDAALLASIEEEPVVIPFLAGTYRFLPGGPRLW